MRKSHHPSCVRIVRSKLLAKQASAEGFAAAIQADGSDRATCMAVGLLWTRSHDRIRGVERYMRWHQSSCLKVEFSGTRSANPSTKAARKRRTTRLFEYYC